MSETNERDHAEDMRPHSRRAMASVAGLAAIVASMGGGFPFRSPYERKVSPANERARQREIEHRRRMAELNSPQPKEQP